MSKKKRRSSAKTHVRAKRALESALGGSIVAGVFFLIGIAFLAVATVAFWQARDFVRRSIATPGRVVDLERGGGTASYTVFTFPDRAGQTHTGRTHVASKPSSHPIGEAITVLYPPTEPEAARIKSFDSLWLFPTFFGAFGAAFTGAGALALIAVRKTYGGLNRAEFFSLS